MWYKFLCAYFSAYFGSFSCINAYIFKGLLGHKNTVPSDQLNNQDRLERYLSVARKLPILQVSHWESNKHAEFKAD
jgi:hypothetical protein